MSFSDTPTSALLFGLFFLLGGITTTAIRNQRDQVRDSYEMAKCMCANLYLCGCSLLETPNIIIPSLQHANLDDTKICYAIADAIMMALRDCQKSRLVHGHITCDGHTLDHAWVEVKLLGAWWVIDPFLFATNIMSRYKYRMFHPKPEVVYNYQDFWSSYRITEVYQRMTHPKTSYVIEDLCQRYEPVR